LTELARSSSPIVELAVEDEASPDAGSNSDSEEVLERSTGATPVLAENPDSAVVVHGHLHPVERRRDERLELDAIGEAGTFAASNTAPAFTSISPGVPMPMPPRSRSGVAVLSSEVRIVPTMASITSAGSPVCGVSTRELPTSFSPCSEVDVPGDQLFCHD
jgi:hypothetical protein